VVVEVGVEVPEDVAGELEGLPEDEEGEGASEDDELDELSFLLSAAPFSAAAGVAGSLPAGGLSLSE
jgi:hypothetical protein